VVISPLPHPRPAAPSKAAEPESPLTSDPIPSARIPPILLPRTTAALRSVEPEGPLKSGPIPTAALHESWKAIPIDAPAEKGLKWLVSVQGEDGGWGQDGGSEGSARSKVKLESGGNDVANTSLVCIALLRSGSTCHQGPYRDALQKGVRFVLSHVEESPADGLAVTKRQETQIQRKLGPFIDTFLATMLLSELDGRMADVASQKQIRAALEKCVAKVEKGQAKDGSWNSNGGWAPVIGTSFAGRALYGAAQKGVAVNSTVSDDAETYARSSHNESDDSFDSLKAGAGVELYQAAQALELATRDEGSRGRNAALISSATNKVAADDRFISGYGSLGGEEFVSYLNISDSLLRVGGKEWTDWNAKIKDHLLKLQNQDGTWAGHHCITGRVACTSAAVMTLLTERTAAKM
jgi:hypothetical protein